MRFLFRSSSPSPMNPRPLLLVAASLLIFAKLFAAEPRTADSTITKATVYADRAIINRVAKVELAAGTQEIVFPRLPATLDEDLLHVSGSGAANASILDVRAEPAQLETTANPRLAVLREQARAVQAELRGLNDRGTVLQQQRDYLDQIRTATVTPPSAEGAALPKLADWQQLVEFYTQSLGRTLVEQQELDRQREDTQARLAAIQREMQALQAPGQRTVKNVVVRLEVAEAGDMELTLAYTVRNASWSPTYDVRVRSADKAITLGYAAMVRQSTGEDWSGVQLLLSTARPALGGTPPELSPWYVREDRPRPMPGRARGNAEEKAVTLSPFEVRAEPDLGYAAGSSLAGARIQRDLQTTSASVQSGLTSATFTIPYPADVPADNAPHKVSIASHPLTGELSHIAVPKLAEHAYLRAAVENTSEFPLIGGPVNLYLDNNYVARSQIETVMPREKFDLDLGVDDSIKVERKLVNRLQENTGIISRNQRVTYDWLITIQNNSPSPQTIVVQDQLPIPQHEKITVKLLAPPANAVRKDEDGLLTWTLDLAPAEKRELPLKISVEHPSDFPIEGLE